MLIGGSAAGAQVALIMSEGGGQGRTKMKASDFRFARVRTWLGGDATERIEGWKTYVYEAAGKMKAVNITKVRMRARGRHMVNAAAVLLLRSFQFLTITLFNTTTLCAPP